MGRTWSVRTHTAVDAREGPVSPHSHCGRWHGEDLISPHSHCSRMHGEDLISPYSHCSRMHGEDLASPRSHCSRMHGEDLASQRSHCSRMHGEDLASPRASMLGCTCQSDLGTARRGQERIRMMMCTSNQIRVNLHHLQQLCSYIYLCVFVPLCIYASVHP